VFASILVVWPSLFVSCNVERRQQVPFAHTAVANGCVYLSVGIICNDMLAYLPGSDVEYDGSCEHVIHMQMGLFFKLKFV
jgi:hypothetical protein